MYLIIHESDYSRQGFRILVVGYVIHSLLFPAVCMRAMMKGHRRRVSDRLLAARLVHSHLYISPTHNTYHSFGTTPSTTPPILWVESVTTGMQAWVQFRPHPCTMTTNL